jgi:hypothetical protein
MPKIVVLDRAIKKIPEHPHHSLLAGGEKTKQGEFFVGGNPLIAY